MLPASDMAASDTVVHAAASDPTRPKALKHSASESFGRPLHKEDQKGGSLKEMVHSAAHSDGAGSTMEPLTGSAHVLKPRTVQFK